MQKRKTLLLMGLLVLLNCALFPNNSIAQKAKKTNINKPLEQHPLSLIGKWISGDLEKGLKSLVLGENGAGTYTFSSDVSLGENGFCRCKYSTKISCTWKVIKDSLFIKFSDNTKEDGDAIVSSSADAIAQRTCKEMSCDIVKISLYGEVNRLKNNTLKANYILAGNTLDWAGTEFKKE